MAAPTAGAWADSHTPTAACPRLTRGLSQQPWRRGEWGDQGLSPLYPCPVEQLRHISLSSLDRPSAAFSLIMVAWPRALLSAACSVVLALLLLSLLASVSNAGMNLTGYTLTWNQDFTLLDSLSVTAWGPAGPGGSTWIAHKPDGEDWCHFQDPVGDYMPFHLGNGGPLVIRAQREGTGNTTDSLQAGLLSSVDGKGRGFSQQYGYFEMRAWLPSGLGTWPGSA
jgi:hypothetical protein